MKLGMTLGMIASPIILSVLFFFVITPIDLLLKVFGKDENFNKLYDFE